MASKANSFLSCPLCNKKYTSVSLKIHWPQCLGKWEREQIPSNMSPTKVKKPKLPIEIQTLLLKFPDFQIKPCDVEIWNTASQNIFEVVSLVPCQYCSRKFLPDRLVVHLRSCASMHGVTSVGFAGAKTVTVGLEYNVSAKVSAVKTAQNLEYMTAMNTPKNLPPAAEDTLPTCKMCHRKFGTASFTIHLVQCGKKNGKSQEVVNGMIYNYQNPPVVLKEAPIKSVMNEKDKSELINFVDKKMAQVNIDAYESFMDGRIECKGCKRKFAEDRIAKHSSICKGK